MENVPLWRKVLLYVSVPAIALALVLLGLSWLWANWLVYSKYSVT